MRKLNKEVMDLIVSHVAEECIKRNIDGVLAIADIYRPYVIFWRHIRRISVLDISSDGKRYNLLSIAMQKITAVLSHIEPSGEVKYEGESNYRGGIPFEDHAYAFSGATEDQDVEIAEVAARYHKSL